jgi:16S rRNA (guanine527-N7)-methyltransferase
MGEKLANYLSLLRKWGRAVELVSARDLAAELENHVKDSLALLPHLPAEARRAVDVGSGGGFPGVVLAIARPELHVVLLEPVHKKWAFLRTARRELSLSNLEPLAQRDDDHLALPDFVPYDVAVSRATWAIPTWLARGARLVRPGGVVLGMEGREQHPLPAGATRHPYAAGGRTRAIILYRP